MNQTDFVAIGDTAIDAFIKIKEASTHTDEHGQRKLCMNFADKVPYESVDELFAVGNSPNASVAAARLGSSSALLVSVGNDQNGKKCLESLEKDGVDIGHIKTVDGKKTNYHYVLWFEDDRTILQKNEAYPYHLPPDLHNPKMIYLSSIGNAGEAFHDEIADYLEKNPEVELVFQPGIFQMKWGVERLKRIYARSDIFICNFEESQRILQTKETDIKKLLQAIHDLGPKIVSITDGPKGAYASDGETQWFMPIYPDPIPPLERTGCGDAFASTFATAINLGKSIEEALLWAPINPMSVVQYVGAQKGLLTREALLKLLSEAPKDYKPRKL